MAPLGPVSLFSRLISHRFLPADALWTLCMAFNVYLTFFHKYDARQLRTLEWKYIVFCYGTPFIPAFVYFFISTEGKGKIYGSATVSPVLSSLAWIALTSRTSSGVGLRSNGTFSVWLSSMAPSGSSLSSPSEFTSGPARRSSRNHASCVISPLTEQRLTLLSRILSVRQQYRRRQLRYMSLAS